MRPGPSRLAISRPSKLIVPAVGVSWSRISLEVVVLPHPDSPMRPSVSPAWTVKSTPSTAFTHFVTPPSSRRRAGKCFLSPRTSRTGEDIVQEPAPGDAAVAQDKVARLVARATRHDVGAPRMEGASGGQVRQVRRLAADGVKRLLVAELRHRAEQRARIGVLGIVDARAHGRLLDDLAGIRYGHAVCDLGDDTQVVRHEDQRDAGLALDVLQ